MRTKKFFLFVVGVSLICSTPSFLHAAETPSAPERVESKDTDGDGKPDEWRIYHGDNLVRIERNRDAQGRPKVVLFFENKKPLRSEVDRNGDGTPDLIRFYKNGVPEKEKADLNFDGKWDAWVFFEKGIKNLMIMDKNHDGTPDAWFYYDSQGMKLIGGRVDDHFDNHFRTFGSVPEKEERIRWTD